MDEDSWKEFTCELAITQNYLQGPVALGILNLKSP